MGSNSIFDSAYPYILPLNKEKDILLSEIKIPPQNIIARLNDQWVEEIGLDISKFGYGHSLEKLLELKKGEKPTKENLLEKIRILQTVAKVFKLLSKEDKDKVIDFIENEQILYPNLKGSRDQTLFQHKKQLTVVILGALQFADQQNHKKSLLDLLHDILEDNIAISGSKSYFDDYNSYTYSEDQRSIALTIVQGIEKKLISIINIFSKDDKLKLLRKLWTLPTLKGNSELRKKVVREVHIGEKDFSINDLNDLVNSLEKEQVPELAVLKEIVIEKGLNIDKDDKEEVLEFIGKNLSDTENPVHRKMLMENVVKMLDQAISDKDKKDIINLIIFPKEDIEDYLGLSKKGGNSHIFTLIELLTSGHSSKDLIFDVLINQKKNPGLYHEIRNKISNHDELYKLSKETFLKLLMDMFKKDKNISFDDPIAVDNIVNIVDSDLIDENLGENFINLLLEKRKECLNCDLLLKKIFQKSRDSILGRYLQYTLLTRTLDLSN